MAKTKPKARPPAPGPQLHLPPPPPPASVHRAVGFGAAICLLVIAVLASGRMVDRAQRLDFGHPGRKALLGGARAWQGVVRAVGADAPERAFAALAGGVGRGPLGELGLGDPEAGLPEPTAVAARPSPATPTSRAPTNPASTSPPDPTAMPSPTAERLRTVTLADPLRVLVIGDSFAEPIGYELERFAGLGEPIASRLDFKIATALTRPDYFDWPAHLAELLAAEPRPEALVVVFGGNENQNMLSPDEESLWTVGDPAWEAEYGRRVAALMDLADVPGLRLYWIGMPPMEDESHMTAARSINKLVPEAARTRPWARFVPSWDLFAGPDGGFVAFQRDATGEERRIRQPDGVHLMRPASDRLTAEVFRAMKRDFTLVTPTPTATETSTTTPTSTPAPSAAAGSTATGSPGPSASRTVTPTPGPPSAVVAPGLPRPRG